MSDFSTYQSPFTWRYSSSEMRCTWSELHKRQIWRRMWVYLAQVEYELGIVNQAQLDDLKSQAANINIDRSFEIEREIHHDLMAEVKAYAEQCPIGGGIIHLGATSMDIKDNGEVLQTKEAIAILLEKLKGLLLIFADKIEKFAAVPCIAYTHLQPAEPTTLGYRLAGTGQDLLEDWIRITSLQKNLRGKGFKGAVGTSASYNELIGESKLSFFEGRLSELLGLSFFPVTGQTYPRSQDFHLISILSGLGATLYKFSLDLRILQSPPFGEISEPFSEKQVGSSAMPFKRNPIKAEQIDSLARTLSQMPPIAWQNAANSMLERTLDDSANRRSLLPESFLICDELVGATTKILRGLQVDLVKIQKNLDNYAPFAATERLLMALVQNGADRQVMHEKLRLHSMAAWNSIQQGSPNDISTRICSDPDLLSYISLEKMALILRSGNYLGLAAQRATEMAAGIRSTIIKK